MDGERQTTVSSPGRSSLNFRASKIRDWCVCLLHLHGIESASDVLREAESTKRSGFVSERIPG